MLPPYCQVHYQQECKVMTVEFTFHGKTYQCAVSAALDQPPPATVTIPFRPCMLRPPYRLELAFLATDEVRGIQLYKPVRELGGVSKEN